MSKIINSIPYAVALAKSMSHTMENWLSHDMKNC